VEEHHFIQKYLLEAIVLLIGGLVALAKILGKKIPKENYVTKIEMDSVTKRIDKGFEDVQHDMDYLRNKLDRLVENIK